MYIARSDREVTTGERQILTERWSVNGRFSSEQIQDFMERLDAPTAPEPSDEELLAAGSGLDPVTLCELVLDAYKLAASDGEVHGSEIRTLRRFLRLYGIPVERFPNIDHWARFSNGDIEQGLELLGPLNA